MNKGGVVFTDKQKDKIIKAYLQQGHTAKDISKDWGISSVIIANNLRKWGVSKRNRRRSVKLIPNELKNKIIKMYTGDINLVGIAYELGISHHNIVQFLRGKGFKINNKIIFNTEQIEYIIGQYNNGISSLDIGIEFGVTDMVIIKTLNRYGVDTSPIRYKVNHNFFEIINTRNKAYWLGFIVTDGCVRNNLVIIHIQKGDKHHLQKFLDDLDSDYVIHEKKTSVSIEISSPKMVADLLKHGVHPRKSKTIKPPTTVPEEFMKDFWRGCVDGDGSVGMITSWGNKLPYIQLVGTKAMCNGFKEFCAPYTKSNAKVNGKRNDSLFTYKISGKVAVPVINILYDNSEPYLNRKKKSAMNILQKHT